MSLKPQGRPGVSVVEPPAQAMTPGSRMESRVGVRGLCLSHAEIHKILKKNKNHLFESESEHMCERVRGDPDPEQGAVSGWGQDPGLRPGPRTQDPRTQTRDPELGPRTGTWDPEPGPRTRDPGPRTD